MAVGFADWGRQTQAASNDILDINEILTGTAASPLTYCGEWTYLNFSVTGGGNANYYNVLAEFYDDSGKVIKLFTAQYTVYGLSLQTFQVPTYGKYVLITVTPHLLTDTAATEVYVRGSTSPHTESWPDQGRQPLLWGDETIAASSTFISAHSRISHGPATLFIQNIDTTAWHADLYWYDFSGIADRVLHRFTSVINGQSATERISLPAAPLKLSISNDDSAASHEFVYSLTAG